MNKDCNKNDTETSKTAPIILIVIVITLWAGSGFILHNAENRGSFGDMFGAINALFSGLAFAGIIYAILLQRKELSLQRHELSLTRRELARSARAQELSEKALTQQAESFALSSQISAIDSMLDIYDKELKSRAGVPYSGNKAREVEKRNKFISEQKFILNNKLENIFKLVTRDN